MVKFKELFLGTAFSAFSIFDFSLYYNTPVNTYETQLLRGTAGYVRQYKGFGPHTPDKVLNYVAENLNVSHDYSPEKTESLKKEIDQLKNHITANTTKEVYQPIFGSLADKLDDESIKYARGHGLLFFAGLMCAGASLFWFANAFGKEEK